MTQTTIGRARFVGLLAGRERLCCRDLRIGSGIAQTTTEVSDVRMPGMDGISLLRHLRARGDDRAVIVVTGNADIPMAIEAIGAGAFDLVEKPYEAETLLGAVRSTFDPQRRNLANQREETQRRFSTLSESERRVFEGIVIGQSNGGVAKGLGITERSVEVHRANAMTKMDAAGLADLVRMALTLKRSE